MTPIRNALNKCKLSCLKYLVFHLLTRNCTVAFKPCLTLPEGSNLVRNRAFNKVYQTYIQINTEMDLSPTENLWSELMRENYMHKPENIKEHKMFCMEEWTKIPPSTTICYLVRCYRKRFRTVIHSMANVTNY